MPAVGLRVERLSKSFPGVKALDDVTLEVARGRVHCLLGGNGSGKSTLIKIVAGVYDADAGGSVEVGARRIAADALTPAWARRAGLRFVHQDLGVFADMSVAENLHAGRSLPTTRWLGRVDRRRMHRRTAELLERFHVDARPAMRLSELRPAQRTMVAIARALQGQDAVHERVLLLDEPTAALPEHEAVFLLETLRRYARAGQTIVLVSHRLEEVLRYGDDVSVLRDGRHVGTAQVADLTRDRLIELIVGRSIAAASTPSGEQPKAAGPPALELTGVRSGPLRAVDLQVRAGEVVGVAGLLGSGRSHVLKTVFGLARPRAGRVAVDGRPLPPGDVPAAIRARLAYLPEDRDREATFADLGVGENVTAAIVRRYWRRGRMDGARESADVRELISRFQIKTRSDRQPIATLSGGNRQKAILARWMATDPSVLLLDEPTQGVDVGARHDIHQTILAAARGGTAVLVVSSDYEELAELCGRVVVLVQGRFTAELRAPDIDARTLGELSFGHDQTESPS